MLDSRTASLIRVSTLASRPDFKSELTEELRRVKESSSAERAELYEVCLQSYLFAGFPAALESVRVLSKVFGPEPGEIEIPGSMIGAYQKYAISGEALYKKVYAANAQKVREEMIRLSPELAAWAMIEGYGKTLSRGQLDVKTRELCIVAMLTQLGWERQLYSHILGARNMGADAAQIAEAARIGAKGDATKEKMAEQLIKKIV
ncbi:MAG: carboxymuconolactone decarboxylase family protein [Bacteroidota bacterium]|nr:carboxymuconolactone decarboxylase family protein [Bacteroidota bacterium]MDP4230862.1 carboxymuconolactone decarboxylase family protein [Bacteroidota bacterium]MDP4236314.1 carboxymuconolactone decarboxylase family protein [Bacteroidota bacterium]